MKLFFFILISIFLFDTKKIEDCQSYYEFSPFFISSQNFDGINQVGIRDNIRGVKKLYCIFHDVDGGEILNFTYIDGFLNMSCREGENHITENIISCHSTSLLTNVKCRVDCCENNFVLNLHLNDSNGIHNATETIYCQEECKKCIKKKDPHIEDAPIIQDYTCNGEKINYEPLCDPKNNCCNEKCLLRSSGTICGKDYFGNLVTCDGISERCPLRCRETRDGCGIYTDRLILSRKYQ